MEEGTVNGVMKGTVTRMVDKTIKVVSAGLATVLPWKQVLVLLHSEATLPLIIIIIIIT